MLLDVCLYSWFCCFWIAVSTFTRRRLKIILNFFSLEERVNELDSPLLGPKCKESIFFSLTICFFPWYVLVRKCWWWGLLAGLPFGAFSCGVGAAVSGASRNWFEKRAGDIKYYFIIFFFLVVLPLSLGLQFLSPRGGAWIWVPLIICSEEPLFFLVVGRECYYYYYFFLKPYFTYIPPEEVYFQIWGHFLRRRNE